MKPYVITLSLFMVLPLTLQTPVHTSAAPVKDVFKTRSLCFQRRPVYGSSADCAEAQQTHTAIACHCHCVHKGSTDTGSSCREGQRIPTCSLGHGEARARVGAGAAAASGVGGWHLQPVPLYLAQGQLPVPPLHPTVCPGAQPLAFQTGRSHWLGQRPGH